MRLHACMHACNMHEACSDLCLVQYSMCVVSEQAKLSSAVSMDPVPGRKNLKRNHVRHICELAEFELTSAIYTRSPKGVKEVLGIGRIFYS